MSSCQDFLVLMAKDDIENFFLFSVKTREDWKVIEASLPSCAECFKEGEGVVGVRTQCYMPSYWPTD